MIEGKFLDAPGTVTVDLKNFGKTTVSAKPGADKTLYIIEVEKGGLNTDLIEKISGDTGFSDIEKNLLGKEPEVFDLKYNAIKIEVPSTEPEICVEYLSAFLKWLDTDYVSALPKIGDFENGISI